jgi:hypothetical protein
MNARKASSHDMLVCNYGSICQLFPLSRRISNWFDQSVKTEYWQWMGSNLVVHWRLVGFCSTVPEPPA